jgi:hypothetical protein
VPTGAVPQVRSAPQRLSGGRDIVFFSVGQIAGRTLVLYMKRKGVSFLFAFSGALGSSFGRDSNPIFTLSIRHLHLLGERYGI